VKERLNLPTQKARSQADPANGQFAKFQQAVIFMVQTRLAASDMVQW